MHEPIAYRRVLQVGTGRHGDVDDSLVVEEPLEIRLGGMPIAVLMRTPGHDADLIRGFSLTEGIALRPGEMEPEDLGGGRWDLVLAEGVEVDPEKFRRSLYATSSCGVCGKASIDAVRVTAAPARPGPVVPRAVMDGLPGLLEAAQPVFAATGAAHAAAAIDAAWGVVVVREDVGRHNAVDKVVGALAHTGWPLIAPILFVSGRISFEIIQKAAVAGIPIVAGVSAASSLAVDLGDELGMTVVGFLRETGFTVYCGPDRIGPGTVGR